MDSVGFIAKQKEKVNNLFLPNIPERPSALTDMVDEAIHYPKGKTSVVWSASFLEHTAEDWLSFLE